MKHGSSARWFALLLCAMVLPALQPATSLAQLDTTVFQLPERTLLQHLTRARRAMDEDRYSDAVIELGALLNSPFLASSTTEPNAPSQDYFVGPVGETGTRRSIKGEAQRPARIDASARPRAVRA